MVSNKTRLTLLIGMSVFAGVRTGPKLRHDSVNLLSFYYKVSKVIVIAKF